jgi:hypothetical protein
MPPVGKPPAPPGRERRPGVPTKRPPGRSLRDMPPSTLFRFRARQSRALVAAAVAVVFAGTAATAQVVVSEINYHSDSIVNPGDWVELHNPGANPVDLTGWTLSDGNPLNSFSLPVGRILQPGGYLVLATDLPDFALVHPSVTNVISGPGFNFSNAGESVVLRNAGGTVVFRVAYEDSVPWPEGADGNGRTLELLDLAGDPDDPANWFDGCMGGSPGTGYTPCDPPLVFSEINYNSPLAPAEDAGDWVELHNRGTTPILLAGYRLKDQRDTNVFVLPSGTILNPGQYLVLARDLAKFQAVHPTVSNVLGSFGFNYSGDGEIIRLHRPDDGIVFSAYYNDAPPWPLPPDGFGPTLELLDPRGRYTRWDNWFDGCPLGSPGGPFVPWCWGSVGPAALADDAWAATAEPGAVRVRWDGAEPARVRVVDAAGRVVAEAELPAGWRALPVPAPGLYRVQVRAADAVGVRGLWVP